MSTRTRLKSSTDFIRARGSRDVMAAHLPMTNRYEVSGCLPRCFEKRHTFVVLPMGDMEFYNFHTPTDGLLPLSWDTLSSCGPCDSEESRPGSLRTGEMRPAVQARSPPAS